MVVESMALQLFLVVAQNLKKPRVLAKEMLIVLTGLKPAIDCFRVCSGQEMEDHHAIEVSTELAITKFSEMVAESIPGCSRRMT